MGSSQSADSVPPACRRIDAEIWSPARISQASAQRGLITLRVLARLRPEVTIEGARSTVTGLIDPADPDDAGTHVSIVSLHEDIVGPVRPVLLVLVGSVLLAATSAHGR